MLGCQKGKGKAYGRTTEGGGTLKAIRLVTPLSEDDVRGLSAGDTVTISGTLVTARDKAYARVASGAGLPVDIKGGVVYNCGPLTRKVGGKIEIVSAGPTTSARMGRLQAEFVRRTGVRAILGKGGLSREVGDQLASLGCVYLAFPGGAGALAAEYVEKIEGVHWLDLGEPEAVWVLRVRDFGPLLVTIDTRGKNLHFRT